MVETTNIISIVLYCDVSEHNIQVNLKKMYKTDYDIVRRVTTLKICERGKAWDERMRRCVAKASATCRGK